MGITSVSRDLNVCNPPQRLQRGHGDKTTSKETTAEDIIARHRISFGWVTVRYSKQYLTPLNITSFMWGTLVILPSESWYFSHSSIVTGPFLCTSGLGPRSSWNEHTHKSNQFSITILLHRIPHVGCLCPVSTKWNLRLELDLHSLWWWLQIQALPAG